MMVRLCGWNYVHTAYGRDISLLPFETTTREDYERMRRIKPIDYELLAL